MTVIKLNQLRKLALSGLFLSAAIASSVSGASAKDNIVLCTIDSVSGDFSIMSTPKTYGYKLAVKEINDAGGIMVDGVMKQIKHVSYDGQSDVGRFQQLAQRCIFEDEADVVMAGYTGAEREAARQEVIRNKVIFWHNNQGEGGIADKYSFFSGPTPEQQVLPAIKYMIEEMGPRMTFIGADYNFCRAIGQWVRVAANLYGGKIEMEEYFPFGVSQWQATIDKIRSIAPDFQAHCLVGGDQVQFYPQAQAAGLTTPMWSNVTISDGYEHKRFAPPSLSNMIVPPAYIEDVPGKASADFANKIREMFPEVVYVNEHAAFGYVAVKAMAVAWDRAGTTNTDNVIKALQEDVSLPDAPGGPWILRGDQHHAAMHTYLFAVQDDHSLKLLKDLGMTEPTFLKDIGVNMRVSAPDRQFLPPDNPAWADFFK